MPKIKRKYERVDYSALLSELSGKEPAADIGQIQPAGTKEKKTNPVSDAHRRRSHLMDNKNMKYAFSRI